MKSPILQRALSQMVKRMYGRPTTLRACSSPTLLMESQPAANTSEAPIPPLTFDSNWQGPLTPELLATLQDSWKKLCLPASYFQVRRESSQIRQITRYLAAASTPEERQRRKAQVYPLLYSTRSPLRFPSQASSGPLRGASWDLAFFNDLQNEE